VTYRLVASYIDTGFVVIDGDPFPLTSLVEDGDGMRILLVAETAQVKREAWDMARQSGAAAVMMIDPPGEDHRFFYGIVDRFSDDVTYYQQGGVDWVNLVGHLIVTDRILDFSGMLGLVPTRAKSTPFVHLHAHSEHSALDGLATVAEMVQAAIDDGQGALAVTDHGVCAGHPDLHAQAARAGIKPVYGMEAYFVHDRHARGVVKPAVKDMADDEKKAALEAHAAALKKAKDYHHLILWAMNDEGLRNLWAMSSAAYLEGFYGKPRLDWEVLERFAPGVMCSTACLRGPLAVPILAENEEQARSNMGRLLDIFGDRLYAEIHTNQLDEQKTANAEIVNLANEHGVPVIAVVDSHYPCAEDAHAHDVWLAAQTNSDLADDTGLFDGAQQYHLMTTEEVKANLAYLGKSVVTEAIANTSDVADRCTAALRPRNLLPTFSKKGTDSERRDRDRDRAVDMAVANWSKCKVSEDHPITEYIERFEEEAQLLTEKGFWGYFLVVAEQTTFAKDNGILVGPGRGSGAGCLIAYLMGITEVDPVEAGLLFERFLDKERDDPPDFDVDYPASKRDIIQDHVSERWGEERTVRVGSVIKLKNRGVFKDLGRIYRDRDGGAGYPAEFVDFSEIGKIIERAEQGAAGLGLSWEDLWAQHGDELEPFKEKYPEIFDLAERFKGRVKSYGRHAAGMVISTDEDLTGALPLRIGEESHQPITQFDMDALALLGYLKFDILTLRTLDTLQMCLDLIKERRGRTINVYDWREEYEDPQVWDEICAGNTKGLFQIETTEGTRLTRRFKPRSIADLADIGTLVRPGPKRSGLTETYFRRREGFEEVTVPDPRLTEVLAPTQGCIIYQEQVMKTCQLLGGYTLTEANVVRSILGKKKVDKVEEAGREFVSRVTANGMGQEATEHLWSQLGEFAKYSFNKSHAWSYAMVGYWTAWFKFHYPIEFFTAVLSTVKKERIPEFVNEARRMGYDVLPPDINESGAQFTATHAACRYGFEGVEGIGEKAAPDIVAGQPYTSFEDFMERKGPRANMGVVKTLARIGAFDSLVANRRALVGSLEWETGPDSDQCQHLDPSVVNPASGLPCRFDWSSEPVILGKSGRPLKAKLPPKRCTKACRQYLAPAAPDWSAVEDYTDDEIMAIEKELLGLYLTATPFDRIDRDDLLKLATGTDISTGASGEYLMVAIITRVKEHTDRNGNKMAFLTMYAQNEDLDVTVFKDDWRAYKKWMKPDVMCFARVKRNGRGISLAGLFQPVIPDPQELDIHA
jgi:DNA polymerase-3 subunit alpha